MLQSSIQSNKIFAKFMYSVNYVEQSALQYLNLQNDLFILIIVFKIIYLVHFNCSVLVANSTYIISTLQGGN